MDKKITADHLQPLNEPVIKKKLAYYQQPWWKGKTHVMDLPSPVSLDVEEVKDGKVTSTTVKSKEAFTMDDWSKMHSDAITNADTKLKAEWDAKRKEKSTLKILFKELNK